VDTARDARFRRYMVNIMVSNGGGSSAGAPVVEELNPIHGNLIGRIEHIAQMGTLVTDFLLIKPGALHKANGGYLLVDARRLLLSPFAWEALKQAVKGREIRIEQPTEVSGLASTQTLDPEPIPLDVKVVLFGDRSLYYMLVALDPDTAQHFKVLADFDDDVDRSAASETMIARLVGTIAAKAGLRPLDRGGVARAIEHAARLADDAGKLTLLVESIHDLVAEASHRAGQAGREVVTRDDVAQTIAQQRRRAARVEERGREMILRDIALIATSGASVGQVNGLSVLALADSLSHVDYDTLKGADAVYLDILQLWLPRMPQAWALPLAIGLFLMIMLAGFLTQRGRRDVPQPVLAGLMPVVLLAGSLGMGFVLHGLAAWISGEPDPSFAHPLLLRLSFAFGVFAVALLAAQRAGGIACWLWLSGLGIIVAIWAPGLTPYFLYPSLVAAPLLLTTVRGGRGAALFIAALAAALIWIGLTAGTEPVMGLKMHPAFTVTAAFGLLALLPLLRPAEAWGWSAGACLLLAMGLAVAAGFQPAFSEKSPQRLNLRYVEEQGRAWWLADPVTHLPQSLRAAARFSAQPTRMLERGYTAPAGKSQFPAPAALVRREGDRVTLNLNAAGDGVVLLVPEEARLKSMTLNDTMVKAGGQATAISCATSDCGSAHIVLEFGSSTAVELTLVARRRGLPSQGARLLKARPATAVPSQGGDATLLTTTLMVPAR